MATSGSPADSPAGLQRQIDELRQLVNVMKMDLSVLKTSQAQSGQPPSITPGAGIQISGSWPNLTIASIPKTGNVNITGVCGDDGDLNFTGTVSIS